MTQIFKSKLTTPISDSSINSIFKRSIFGRTMSRKAILATSLLATAIFLTGCSSKNSGPEFSEMENTQFEEMVVFVVGAKFLKSHCGNTQIPTDDKLELNVARMAQQRGWDIDNFISRENGADSKLMIASEQVYQRLIKDPNMYLPRQVAMKCKQIGQTLAPLI